MHNLGLIARGGEIRIANPICGEVVPRELTFIVPKHLRQQASRYVDSEGGLQCAKLLAAFQQFFPRARGTLAGATGSVFRPERATTSPSQARWP